MDNQQRARELLAAQLPEGDELISDILADNFDLQFLDKETVIAAITAALRAAPAASPYGWVITSDSGSIFCPAAARSVMESNSTELSKQFGITVVEVFANGLTAIPCPVPEPRPLHEWHEDYGPAVWWSWDDERSEWLGEPAWIGSPGDSDWPGYHTHWTPHPELPVAARQQG